MKLVDRLNNALITYALLIAFLLLAYYSYQDKQEHGYQQSDVESLNELIRTGAVQKHPRDFTEAELIADVWNLTQVDVTQPVYLFGKDGGKI